MSRDIQTIDDYRAYQATVDAFAEHWPLHSHYPPECLECGCGDTECEEYCPECGASMESQAAPFFSWYACDVCDGDLGGNRYRLWVAQPGPEGKQEGPYDCCEDCLHYLEHGRLDDATMDRLDLD